MTAKKKYKWEYENIGGSSRVRITTGSDIAHLSELDPKKWTVLSCPVSGLEIDDRSLSYIDCDADGKIRVNDIICTSRWVTGVLKNPDLLLEGKDSIDIEQIDRENKDGGRLYASARQILDNLGKEGSVISIADTTDIAAIFSKTRFNGDGVITVASSDDEHEKAAIAAAVASMGGVADRSGETGVDAAMIEAFYSALSDYSSWCEAAVEAPYGADTDMVIEAYNALDAKVRDFFMRSRLAAFSPDSTSSLDVQTSRIESISSENLTGKMEEIASYPISRVTGKAEISLDAPVNPAWAGKFAFLRKVALPAKAKVLTEEMWDEIGRSFASYLAWKNAKAGASVEGLGVGAVKDLLAQDKKQALLDLVAQDAALAEEAGNIENVTRFLYIFRDFYRLLRNFITFHDFYDRKKTVKAIFQSGTLIIDQRACNFCMKVADMAKHNAMAASSGMFLLYVDCTTKSKPGKLQIVAAVTVGDIGDLIVGKNAVYYDNEGVEWDAVITKVVDNPISISQSFWSPYRRMAKAVENLINKSAADKDAKIMKDATEKINAAPAVVPAAGDSSKMAAQPFDIGKFAGIFAALGMALGMIGSALVSLFEGLNALPWWKLILAVIGVMLVISGPAMIMAWLKLRRRNIAPLLNANGWAVNAASKVSIPFGETLTDRADFPVMKLTDPYAKKGLAPWKKWMISASAVAVVLVGLWLGNLLAWANLKSPLPRFRTVEVVELPVEQAADVTAEEVVDAETVIQQD